MTDRRSAPLLRNDLGATAAAASAGASAAASPAEARSASANVPDDIKIIAQFLARREGAAVHWREHVNAAFKLRRELKTRSRYGS